MVNPSVVRQDVIPVRSVAEQANDGRVLSLEDLHDAAFRAAIRTAAPDPRKHPVAVHRIVDAVVRDEKIAVDPGNRRVRHYKPVAIPMSDDSPRDEIRIPRTLWSSSGNRGFRVDCFARG